MDTSETYIKMCDCPEIQEQFPNEVGCLICGEGRITHYNYEPEPGRSGKLEYFKPFIILNRLSKHRGHLYHTTARFGDGYGSCEYFNKVIWLPRQDQLQDMIVDNYYQPTKYVSMHFFFDDWLWEYVMEDPPLNQPESAHVKQEYYGWSMEQLWLAFVMKEKFNKTWEGGKWI